MKTLRTLMATVGLLLALAVSAVAQTTINSTTLAAAVASSDTQIRLASTTSVSVGDYIVVVTGNRVREVMIARAVTSPVVTVSRAFVTVDTLNATRVHASGSTVYTGVQGRFYAKEAIGTCTSTAERFLPHIVLATGNISQCSVGGVWYRLDQQFNVVCRTTPLATGSIDQSCWQADGNYVLVGINEVHTVKEAGGTLTLIPRKQTTTQAAASGASLGTALDMAAAATVETVRPFVLTTTGADLLLAAGNRLGLDFTDDVAGELAGVVVTFTLAPR